VSAKGGGEDDSELLNKIKDGLEYVMKMQQLGSPRGGKVQASATVAEIGEGSSKRTSLPKSAKRVEKKVVRKPKGGENQQQTEEFLSKLGLGRHIPKMRGYGFTSSMQALAALENTQLLALELAPRDQSAMLGAIAALRAKLLIQRGAENSAATLSEATKMSASLQKSPQSTTEASTDDHIPRKDVQAVKGLTSLLEGPNPFPSKPGMSESAGRRNFVSPTLSSMQKSSLFASPMEIANFPIFPSSSSSSAHGSLGKRDSTDSKSNRPRRRPPPRPPSKSK
jgi:hypothetical protein